MSLFEDKAVVDFLFQITELGQPVRMKHISGIVFQIIQCRPAPIKPSKPPNKKWAKAFEQRHPELKTRKVRALDWNRHNSNIYQKIIYWFEVIRTVLQDSAIVPENIYNIDETGITLSKLGSVKVLTASNDNVTI